MAHFAELDQNNIVINVVVVDNNVLIDENGNENEQLGIDLLHSHLGSDKKWVQTSYNHNFRGRYAGKGYTYDENFDIFFPPQPYPSWTLNSQIADWEAPIPRPEFTQEEIDSYCWYEWNEDQYQLDNNTGWELRYPN